MKLLVTWEAVLAAAFVGTSATSIILASIEPDLIGSHAVIYTDAARTWLAGGDPWTVGPPMVVFSGPPPMLLLFAPFTLLSDDLIRFSWFLIDAALALAVVIRLGLPRYWLAFPPLVEAVVLGHPEIVVLALLVLGASSLAGLAVVVKVYASLPLLAERRWRALALAAAVLVATIPILPWSQFFEELPMIQANLARQSVGDSVYGQPLLMGVAVLALAALGPRLGLWLAVPVLWPFAQPIYKVMTMPVLPPLVALLWAIPVPGLTLAGVVIWAAARVISRRLQIPDRVIQTLEPAARPQAGAGVTPFFSMRRATVAEA